MNLQAGKSFFLSKGQQLAGDVSLRKWFFIKVFKDVKYGVPVRTHCFSHKIVNGFKYI